MKAWLKITLGVLVVLGLAAASGAWWLTRPTEAQAFSTTIDQQWADTNSIALSVLADAGFEDAFADVNETRVIIAFPADAARDDEAKLQEMMDTALATAAGASGTATTAYILATIDQQPHLKWEADIPTFKDMIEGRMSEEAYLASIVRTEF